jgi:hypothetical protein
MLKYVSLCLKIRFKTKSAYIITRVNGFIVFPEIFVLSIILCLQRAGKFGSLYNSKVFFQCSTHDPYNIPSIEIEKFSWYNTAVEMILLL